MPFRFHVPMMVPPHPASDAFKESVPRLGVAVTVNIVTCQLLQRVRHIGGGAEIHVRHPQGKNILRIPPPRGKVVFQASRVFSADDGVKVQVSLRHGLPPLFYDPALASRAAPSKACSRSRRMSSGFSIPTDSRSSRSVIPSFFFCSSGTSGWVCSTG